MAKSLDQWEKEFVKTDDLKGEDLSNLLEKATKYCEITSDGYVRIKNIGKGGLSDKDQIQLILTARYLAHELQFELKRENPIPATVKIEEIANMMRAKNKLVASRISDLRKEGAILDMSRGIYRIALHSIDDFLDKLSSTTNGGA